MKELIKCPFCGSDHTDDWTWISELENGSDELKFVLHHYCQHKPGIPTVVITIYGSYKEEVIERWNNRGEKHSSN